MPRPYKIKAGAILAGLNASISTHGVITMTSFLIETADPLGESILYISMGSK